MSACISRQGEYGEHLPGDDDALTCRRCFMFDESAARLAIVTAQAEVLRLRAAVERVEVLAAEYAEWPDDPLDDDAGDYARELRAAVAGEETP